MGLLLQRMSQVLARSESSLRRRAIVRLLGSCRQGQNASLTRAFDPQPK
jgi:hypothetical protein